MIIYSLRLDHLGDDLESDTYVKCLAHGRDTGGTTAGAVSTQFWMMLVRMCTVSHTELGVSWMWV